METDIPMRKSIFDLERRTDLYDDLDNLYRELNGLKVTDSNYVKYSLAHYLDLSIKDWPYRQAATSIDGFFEDHGVNIADESIPTSLMIIELYVNLLHWAPYHDKNVIRTRGPASQQNITNECRRILENLEYILEQNNYSIRSVFTQDDEYHIEYLIYKRNAYVDSVVESVPELADTLLSYLDIRNADSEQFKRSALRQIADYLEPIRKAKKYKGTSYYQLSEDVFTVFNRCNIRHNNPEFNEIPKNQRFKIYDDTFRMSLHLMQMDDVNQYKSDVDMLKRQLDE